MAKAPSLIRDRLLEALARHPLLSRRQLELYLALPGRSVRQGVEELRERGLVQRYNARQPGLYARSLLTPTAQGIQVLARSSRITTAEHPCALSLSSARLERLLLLTERVFQLRTFFLWITGSQALSRRSTSPLVPKEEDLSGRRTTTADRAPKRGWHPAIWDVEMTRFFSTSQGAFWIPFHAAAMMVKPSSPGELAGRWTNCVVEFDLRRVPVERDRERLARFVAAQDDQRFWGPEQEHLFPILLLIAQDELRLQDYYTVLQSAALSRRLALPRAYLTTVTDMLFLREDPSRPIWYSTISGHRVPLLFDTEGIAGPPPGQLPWRPLPLVTVGASSSQALKLEEGNPEIAATRTEWTKSNEETASARDDSQEVKKETKGKTVGQAELVQLALALTPLAKQLLDEVAAHPLLTLPDLVLLSQKTRRKVRLRVEELCRLKLIELHRVRYLLTPRGEAYLAMVAGFSQAVRRHARARGWAGGYEALLRHLEHTRAENDFFLHLAAIAQRHGHSLRWLSELEGRLYYELGERRHSFLPDGRGTYRAGSRRYEFAVEIDRTRASQEKMRRKFAEYAACVQSNVLRREGIELLRVLVLTSSWERAAHLACIAVEVAREIPVLITTFDRVQASGANAPIWLSAKIGAEQGALGSSKTYCFGCFEKESPRARPPPN